MAWDSEDSEESSTSPEEEWESWQQQATELLREGLLSKACGVLAQEPPVEVTDAVEAEMRAKHPQARQGEKARLQALRPISSAAATQGRW